MVCGTPFLAGWQAARKCWVAGTLNPQAKQWHRVRGRRGWLAGGLALPAGREDCVRARDRLPAAAGAQRGLSGKAGRAGSKPQGRPATARPGGPPRMLYRQGTIREPAFPAANAGASCTPERAAPSAHSEQRPGPRRPPPRGLPQDPQSGLPLHKYPSSAQEKAAIQKRAEGRAKVPLKLRDSFEQFLFFLGTKKGPREGWRSRGWRPGRADAGSGSRGPPGEGFPDARGEAFVSPHLSFLSSFALAHSQPLLPNLAFFPRLNFLFLRFSQLEKQWR